MFPGRVLSAFAAEWQADLEKLPVEEDEEEEDEEEEEDAEEVCSALITQSCLLTKPLLGGR